MWVIFLFSVAAAISVTAAAICALRGKRGLYAVLKNLCSALFNRFEGGRAGHTAIAFHRTSAALSGGCASPEANQGGQAYRLQDRGGVLSDRTRQERQSIKNRCDSRGTGEISGTKAFPVFQLNQVLV